MFGGDATQVMRSDFGVILAPMLGGSKNIARDSVRFSLGSTDTEARCIDATVELGITELFGWSRAVALDNSNVWHILTLRDR